MTTPRSAAHGPARGPVFYGASVIIFLVLGVSVVATKRVGSVFDALQDGIVRDFGWFYVLSMTGFLLFAVWLAVSKVGATRLGPDDSRPEFGTLTWLAMLFSAGMGIGLLFFGVAEPIMHFDKPPVGLGDTPQAASRAMSLTFFHWGLHPWAVYSTLALSLAYFGFRKGLPFSLRAGLYPLLGDGIYGRVGHLVDTLAVVSTLFGVATSLGLGAMQVNAGLHHVFGLDVTTVVQVVIIFAITALATLSVVSGLHVGVRRLSELNMVLAALLLAFVFFAGPTGFLVQAWVENIGTYLQNLPIYSFRTGVFAGPKMEAWMQSWTIFYWAWWIAWAPFVGMFIARISYGRTIREFLGAVLLAPTLIGFLWLTVFGDTALHVELFEGGGIVSAVSQSVPTAVFVLLERFPLASATSVLCTVCVVLFFVTSSDSASLVVDTIASGGNPNPPLFQRIYWAVLEGVTAAVLLLAGGLKALQTAAITTALPFCVVIIATCVGLARALLRDETQSLRAASRASSDTSKGREM